MKTMLTLLIAMTFLSSACLFGCSEPTVQQPGAQSPDKDDAGQVVTNGGASSEDTSVSEDASSKDTSVTDDSVSTEETKTEGETDDAYPEYSLKFMDYGKTYTEKLSGKDNTVKIDLVEKSEWESDYVITIDGKEFSDVAATPLYPAQHYCIFDLDVKDGKLQIALQDFGYSSDYSMQILEYDGEELYSLGFVSGVFDERDEFGDTTCAGDGRIKTYIRLSAFQTWHARADFVLSDGEIVLDEKDYYEAIDPIKDAYLLEDITVYSSPDKDSKTTVLQKGTVISPVGTDDREWVKILAGSDEYWIRLADDGISIISGDSEYFAGDVISGLCYAD